jgi:CubicO group peptidase (beta-lactamase class C family)
MANKEIAGFSAARLQRIDRVLTEKYVATGQIPGYVLQIFRRGTLAHTGTGGSRDIARGQPMQDDTLFRIYSMTKPITAVAAMMLAEEGKIGLDDEVQQHIPAWRNQRVYVSGIPGLSTEPTGKFITVQPKRPVKVIDLLTHTSGLTYGFMMRTAVDAEYRRLKIGDFGTPGGLNALAEQLAAVPLDFSPGERWNYSVSLDVAGYLVQKLSGQHFGDFLRTRLFEPLGMMDTAFFVPEDKLDRFGCCYMPKKDRGLEVQDDGQASTFLAPPVLESGGGGLVSTAGDYIRFCRMMLNGGTLDGACILSSKTVEMFSRNFLPGGKLLSDMVAGEGMFTEAGYAGVGFSLGCGVTMDLAKTRLPGSVGEYFWGGAAATAFWIDPKEDLAVVFMTQVLGSESRLALRRDLRTLVYSAIVDGQR